MNRNKNNNGNRAVLVASHPKARAKPAIHRRTRPRAVREWDSNLAGELHMTESDPRIARGMERAISEERWLKMRRRSRYSSQAEINGISRICEASSLPRE